MAIANRVPLARNFTASTQHHIDAQHSERSQPPFNAASARFTPITIAGTIITFILIS